MFKILVITIFILEGIIAATIDMSAIPATVNKNTNTATSITLGGDISQVTSINIKSSRTDFIIDVTSVDVANKKVSLNLKKVGF